MRNLFVAIFYQNQKLHYSRPQGIFILFFFSTTARHLPFRVGVDFDNNERAAAAIASMSQTYEQQGAPAGIVGFKLTYFQVSC